MSFLCPQLHNCFHATKYTHNTHSYLSVTWLSVLPALKDKDLDKFFSLAYFLLIPIFDNYYFSSFGYIWIFKYLFKYFPLYFF